MQDSFSLLLSNAANAEGEGEFVRRHIGPGDAQASKMLKSLGFESLEAFTRSVVPPAIYRDKPLDLPAAASETAALAELKKIAVRNKVAKSYLGMGYSDTLTPSVIQRNILENPGWYTQYTPYQAEIAQGRLEALLNFQTMVADLTGMAIANASLLDEGTAAAEAVTMLWGLRENTTASKFFVASDCHPQTLAVVTTRALPMGIEIVTGDPTKVAPSADYFGALLSYPTTDGSVLDYSDWIARAHSAKAKVAVVADLLSLCLLKSPGEMGADVVVGNSQRFGVPMGFGGPHAAFLATKEEFQRRLPGRIVGVSKDRAGNAAIRLALQTREQHIRRDKATSNICTAQVLLAVMASMYAVYHGPEGLKQIAARTHGLAIRLAAGLKKLGLTVLEAPFFDTVKVKPSDKNDGAFRAAQTAGANLRRFADGSLGIALDETTTEAHVAELLGFFGGGEVPKVSTSPVPNALQRSSSFLTHPVFSSHQSETAMLRYIRKLESKDLSLTHSMIPLGSCTMKLNATSELFPVTWPEFNHLHPFAPEDQTEGYRQMTTQLEKWLAEITGFAATSLQPNSGAQGEYAGLLAIRHYHHSRGDVQRTVCLIPESAHGTNPASAVMAGMRVVGVKNDAAGNIDMADLKAKAEKHAPELAACMATYPSTYGVFETEIKAICEVVHKNGGQVYMDGANMNAQVGLCRPGDFGPDVCHLNLHKTFCIPHGGGGPGVGPICVKAHLAPFLPGNPLKPVKGTGPVSSANWGSASILPISWMYIRMMGPDGLRKATQLAILNANYVAGRLEKYFPVLYKGGTGRVAHECILDMRGLKKEAGVEVEDVAKRLMDYGFHAPTISWPVAGTMMVEPTESEGLGELDRFCDAMIAIAGEAQKVAAGTWSRTDNPLSNAPHTVFEVTQDEWKHGYSREVAAFPSKAARERKFWPSVARIDNVYGDRNLFCACPPVEELSENT
jgi:glycine dehydrogenase